MVSSRHFKNVTQSKAPHQIINQVRASILRGELKPGDKLDSEAALMEEFGVSKSTLREALRALECFGLVEIRKGAGGGAFVAEVNVEITKDSLINFLHSKNLSIPQIFEIRRYIEPPSSRAAAIIISEEALSSLKKINEICEDAFTRGDMRTVQKNIIGFHRIIANVTQNPIIILIKDFLDSALDETRDLHVPDTEFSRKVIEAHRKIYQALKERNPERAYTETLIDIEQVEEELTRLSKEATSRGGIRFRTSDE